jgi:hypothetical protein
MSRSFVDRQQESWGSRLAASLKGVLAGAILATAAFPVMWCNEGRAVQTARSLDEGAGAVVSVSADHVDAALEGALVHMTARADTQEWVRDFEFGISAQGLKLVRTVEMYQWRETEKTESRDKLGGGRETVTTYSYHAEWASRLIDSRSFRKSDSYPNPLQMPWPSRTTLASRVEFGAFVLPPELIGQIEQAEAVVLDTHTAVTLPPGTGLRADGGYYYRGSHPDAPQVGDVRVSFKVAKPAVVSIVARQTGITFAPFQTRAGNALLMLDEGRHTADEMFAAARHQNAVLTWILRAVGVLLLFLGFVLIFRPIATLGSVVPLVGHLLGAGLALASLGLALAVSSVTIAVAWFVYRPLLSITLMCAAGIVVVAVRLSGRRKTS